MAETENTEFCVDEISAYLTHLGYILTALRRFANYVLLLLFFKPSVSMLPREVWKN